MNPVEAVIFDLDGVLLDSEQVWDEARRALTLEMGGRWSDAATRDMMGMSSTEWSAYMHDNLGLPLDPANINREVVDRMRAIYSERLPLIPGAGAAVKRMAKRWPLGLASSSNRELIDLVLDLAGMRDLFRVTVSSEEVARGKPSPDVYLEVARRMGFASEACVAIEDSANGIRSAKAAGMRVIAIPNPALPPEADALAPVNRVLVSLDDLTADVVEGIFSA